MKRTKGFTLVELLVVIAIIALLVSILLPTLGRAKELAKQAICGANLNGIGKGFVLYQAENNDFTPWISTFSATAKTGDSAASILAVPPTASATALMFMVVRSGQTVDLFRCPSDENADRMTNAKFDSGGDSYYYWDFYDSVSPSTVNHCKKVSYSIQAPLAPSPYSVGFTSGSKGGLAIMADKTPEFDKTTDAATTPKAQTAWNTTLSDTNRKRGMSQNHNKGDFINVLYSDAHVSGSKRADVGIGNDNIYSASGLTTGGTQGAGTVVLTDHKHADDSFLIGPIK